MSDRILDIALDRIEPDPNQPRQSFDETELRELAASIRMNGLLQPITVRRVGINYVIVAGERRYRAHRLLEATSIRAIVHEPADTSGLRILQIIENDCRADVSQLEQARAYRALMDETTWSVEELARRIGKAPHRITERVELLKLRDEYLQLFASGNIKPSEAAELSRLSPRGQDVLFRAIKHGQCKNYNDLRACANALVEAESQGDMLPVEPPNEEERSAVRSFEGMVERVGAMLRAGVRDNQIIALKKVNPDRASTLADILAAMGKDIRRIEVALREAAVQAELLAGAAA